MSSSHRGLASLAAGVWILATGTSAADCPHVDLTVVLNTGWDHSTGGAPIPPGQTDDDWDVVGLDPSGGPTPRAADVVAADPAWLTLPDSGWITADLSGPTGTYRYETCWCMDDDFASPSLTFEIRADDQADVLLNGTLVLSLPGGTFNDPTPAGTSVVDPALFVLGVNCLQVVVENLYGTVTGFDLTGTVTADDGLCCDCPGVTPCPCAELPPDAEGWWPLDETVGITANELLHDHDGTWLELSGTPPSPTPVTGKVAVALSLDGEDDYVAVPDDPGLDFGPGQDFTFDAWIRTTSTVRQAILHKKKPGFPLEPGYSFMTSGTLNLEIADGTSYHVCIGTENVADGEWHFVAATVDRDLPAGVRLYVDGVIDVSCDPTAVTGSLENAELLHFGADPLAIPNARKWWDGELDEIEIFRRALDITEIEALHAAQGAGKCPPVPCEESSGIPVCEGPCPPGWTCVTGPPPTEPCTCVPETTTCEDSLPECNGPCPDPDDVCTEIDGACQCEPRPLCEGQEAHPECDAVCPPGYTCESNGQRCHCETRTPCELSPYPFCDGVCPVAGVECQPDAESHECFCPIDPPLCEGFATFPACDGACPDDPTDVCINNGQRCHCEQQPHCGGPGDHPTCDDACPPGLVCENIGVACECIEPVVPCGDTTYPECDGTCPSGQTCSNIVGTDLCDCQPEPVPCDGAPYPACNGGCPPGLVCKPEADQTCGCLICGTGVPVNPPIVISMEGGHKIRWTSVTCALVYNLYRGVGPKLRDQNADGLADDYGSCHIGDVIGTDAVDPGAPQPGWIHWYLVTAENFAGEGQLGETSGGQPRQATGVCP